MSEVVDTEEDEHEAAVEEDDEPPSRVSFFAEGDDAEERVCRAVWNMFVKDSNSRGFDARTRQQRAASGAVIARRQESAGTASTTLTEAKMGREKGDDGLTDKQRVVLEAYRDIIHELGEDHVTNEEIAKRAKVAGETQKSRNANVCGVLRVLRSRGLLNAAKYQEEGAKAPAPAAKKAYAKKAAAPKPEVTGKAKSGRAGGKAAAKARAKRTEPASDDPILTELRARREALAGKLAKLDLAIDAFQAAS